MTSIRRGATVCTVVVTVDADAEVMPDLEAHASDGLAHFAEFDGFLAGSLHKSQDGTRLIQYLQWVDEAAHRRCMDDPRWDTLPSAQRFMALVESGRATLDVRTYDVVAGIPE